MLSEDGSRETTFLNCWQFFWHGRLSAPVASESLSIGTILKFSTWTTLFG